MQENKDLTADEIVALPRFAAPSLELPPEGLFFGSASYGDDSNENNLSFSYTGHAHCRWCGSRPSPSRQIKITAEEGLGNTIQFWQMHGYLYRLACEAKDAGIYSMNIYADDNPEVAKKLSALGKFWLGYDTGERFRYVEADSDGKEEPTLKDIADAFVKRVHGHVSARHLSGWGNVLSTGADFSMDYQVLGGVDIPCTEDVAFRNLNVASALERGVARQFSIPVWGSHNAHEWYAFIPFSNPLRMPMLYASYQLKYMAGAKIIIHESGNWELQTVLCEDSPLHQMPHVAAGAPGIHGASKEELAPYMEEARAKAHLIGYDSEACAAYRSQMRRFWEFVKENPAPKGEPETAIAIAKGNLDLSNENGSKALPIGGAQRMAEKNQCWYPGAPEDSFKLASDIFFPLPKDILSPNQNFILGGTPYGMCDLASFAYDRTTGAHLLANYKALFFAGWNTCSKKQYGILSEYVRGGGRLVISLPHLSTDATRKYQTFTLEDLVNGGDFSELCGLKVTGRTRRIWWATAPDADASKEAALGRRWPARFGIMGMKLGQLEFTRPAGEYEMLAVDDEEALPVVVKCKTGKGEVYFVNTWCYPSVADTDEGAGEKIGSGGLMSALYRHVALKSRGNVYQTGAGKDVPDAECDYVAVSYFPEDGRIFVRNLDFLRRRTIDLHVFGEVKNLVLEPEQMLVLRVHG